MRYLSLFSGVGGFEKGIEQAYESIRNAHGSENGTGEEDSQGNEGAGLFTQKGKDSGTEERPAGQRHNDLADEGPLCVGYSEIDRYAIQTYQKHYPEHKNYGDIKLINEKELPDFDLLVGGFPCQSFSIAGKRGGFADTRGTLFFDIARILNEKQPRLFLLENVKGLLSHDDGRTFRTIVATLDELGYDLQWQVLNSKNFGVPQNRERVLIVGHLRGTPRPEVFPLFGQGNENTTLGKSAETAVARTLTAGGHSGGNHSGMTVLSKTVRSGGRSSPHGSKQNWDSYEVEGQIRRLTPIECERLQGFPDNWTAGVSDTQRYRQCGNAVSVPVIQAVVERMLL